MYMALSDVIEVNGCKSMQLLRSQSRNGVLTTAAFISGHGRSVQCGQPPACRRDPRAGRRMCHRIVRSIFGDRFRMRSILHWHVHQLDRRDHAFVQPHQSLQRAAIRSLNVSICASSRSRCQLIVGLCGLAKVEEGNHVLYGNPVTSGSTGATADVISSTTREQTNRCSTALLFAKGSRAISMHSGQVAASELMVAA